MLKLYFLPTICRDCDTFRSILIIFMELLNINKECFIDALLMFSKSLKINNTDRNMSDLWQIVGKKYNFNISAFVGLIVWIVVFWLGILLLIN